MRWKEPLDATTRFAARRDGCVCARAARAARGEQVNDAQLEAKRDVLRQEHRDLDDAITALAARGTPDQLQMARLKKRKLRLRDEIALLDDALIPDIIA